nr:MAG TPA: hypothetical protein [Caudoviricetes sp.]
MGQFSAPRLSLISQAACGAVSARILIKTILIPKKGERFPFWKKFPLF